MSADYDQLVAWFTKAHSIVVFTGAGISTASGIPDYRGPNGVWKTRKPIFYHDFMEDPEARVTYWIQKAEDWNEFGQAQPTEAHMALKKLEDMEKLRCVITQNIDGLHHASGITEDRLVELHGNIRDAECMTCGHMESSIPHFERVAASAHVPACSACGEGFLKPGVISFGQGLREKDLEEAQRAIQETDLVLALGSSLSVQPAATFPLIAAQNGIPYVVINQGPTAHDDHPLVAFRLEGDLQEILPEAVSDAAAMFG